MMTRATAATEEHVAAAVASLLRVQCETHPRTHVLTCVLNLADRRRLVYDECYYTQHTDESKEVLWGGCQVRPAGIRGPLISWCPRVQKWQAPRQENWESKSASEFSCHRARLFICILHVCKTRESESINVYSKDINVSPYGKIKTSRPRIIFLIFILIHRTEHRYPVTLAFRQNLDALSLSLYTA